jgi:hypothetical protein
MKTSIAARKANVYRFALLIALVSALILIPIFANNITNHNSSESNQTPEENYPTENTTAFLNNTLNQTSNLNSTTVIPQSDNESLLENSTDSSESAPLTNLTNTTQPRSDHGPVENATSNSTINQTDQYYDNLTGDVNASEELMPDTWINESAVPENETSEQQQENESLTTLAPNQPPVLVEQIPDIYLYMTANATVKLEQYFIDPDSDNLTFSSQHGPSLSIVINHSTAEIVPLSLGTAAATFFANDSINITPSNQVHIHVLEQGTVKIEAYREQSEGVGPGKNMTVLFVVWNKEDSVSGVDVTLRDSYPSGWSVAGYLGDFDAASEDNNTVILRLDNMSSDEVRVAGYLIQAPDLKQSYYFQASLEYLLDTQQLETHAVNVDDSRAYFELELDAYQSDDKITRTLAAGAVYPVTFTVRNIGAQSVIDYETYFRWFYNSSFLEIFWVDTDCQLESGRLLCTWPTFAEEEPKLFSIGIIAKQFGHQQVKSNVTYDPPEYDIGYDKIKDATHYDVHLDNIYQKDGNCFVVVYHDSPEIQKLGMESPDIIIASQYFSEKEERIIIKLANYSGSPFQVSLGEEILRFFVQEPTNKITGNVVAEPGSRQSGSILAPVKDFFSRVFRVMARFFSAVIDSFKDASITGEVVREAKEDRRSPEDDAEPDGAGAAPEVQVKDQPTQEPVEEEPAAVTEEDKEQEITEEPAKRIPTLGGGGGGSAPAQEPKKPPKKKVWHTSILHSYMRVRNISSPIPENESSFVEVLDSQGRRLDVNGTITVNDYGTYDVGFVFESASVQSMDFMNLTPGQTAGASIGFDEVPGEIGLPGKKSLRRVCAIDPSQLSFDSAYLTAVAVGDELYKCANWQFSQQHCAGQWDIIMTLTPGQPYTVAFTSTDPAFGEAFPAGALKKLTVKGKKSYKSHENAKFYVNLTDEDNLTVDANITSYLQDPAGFVRQLSAEVTKKGSGQFEIDLASSRSFKPGKYELIVQSGSNYTQTQDFTWGVLAINTHKSIYLENETAFIGIGVLDDTGSMVCDANVTLIITDASNTTTVLSTDNGLINVSGECEVYGITKLPDYYGYYHVSIPGTYIMNLTAITDKGVRSQQDSFLVAEEVDFDVSRDTATRIWPFTTYTVNITITANQNHNGIITEYVPASFNITNQTGMTVIELGDTKILSWSVDLKKDDTVHLAYEYDAPDISPYFYLLGTLTIGTWQEYRYWQIASDAGCTLNDMELPTGNIECAVGSSYTMQCTAYINGKDTFDQHAQYDPGTGFTDLLSTTAELSTDSPNYVTHVSSATVTDTWTVDCNVPGDWDIRCHVDNGADCTSVTRTVTVTDQYPQWSNNNTDAPSTYSKTQPTRLNITWTDNDEVDIVWIELNYTGVGVNYSMSLAGGDVYNFSKVFKAGSYYWRSFANDTFNQWNGSFRNYFTIGKATPLLNVTINGTRQNWTIGEDSSLWLNGSTVTGESPYIELYFNNTIINNGSSPVGNYTLFDWPGYHNITVRHPPTENFTAAATITLFINVTDISPPNITMDNPPDRSYDSDGDVDFRFNVSDYSDIANCSLYFSDTLIPPVNKSVDKSKTQKFGKSGLGDGDYNWKIRCFDVLGYESNSTTWKVTVDTNPPDITLTSPSNYSFDTDGTVQMTYSLSETNRDTCHLYTNFSGIWKVNQTHQVPAAGANSYNTVDLPDGSFIWNVWCNDSAANFNWSLQGHNFTIFVDTGYPAINFTGPTPSNNTNLTTNSITINVTVSEQNPDTFILDWNGTNQSIKPYGPYVNITKTGLVDGVYYYYAWANESSGKSNTTGTRKLLIDTTAPSLYLEAPAHDTWQTANDIQFFYNASDNLAGIRNCSLIIDGELNVTNSTVQESQSQYFRIYLGNSYGYAWSVNCTDKLDNTNTSETRTVKVDSTLPTAADEHSNASSVPFIAINDFACLNLTVADTWSGVRNVTGEIDFPVSGLRNITFTNLTTGCGGAGGDVWSNLTISPENGTYFWVRTFIYDNAGNKGTEAPTTPVNWTALSQIFMQVNMSAPITDFELNESTAGLNSSYPQSCNVSCRDDSTGTCDDVVIYAQYESGTWQDITTSTTLLRSDADSYSCGQLLIGHNCSHTFNITVGRTAGGSKYELRCRAGSSTAGVNFGLQLVNLTVNDFPVANFTYPSDSSYLGGNVTLNASGSTDDQGITQYVFELDDNTGFGSSTVLCTTVDENCTFNTAGGGGQCAENSWDCYLRLTVTDSDGLKNSTIVNIQIDNNLPKVFLDSPANSTWSSSSDVTFQYTAIDPIIDVCVLYHNATGTFKANQSNTTVASGVPDTMTVQLPDGSFIWNVWCNDSAGNGAFNRTNITFFVDTTYPTIYFTPNTLPYGSYAVQDYVYVEITGDEDNEANVSFSLYNTSGVVNKTTLPAGTRSINFTNLDSNMEYYYNATITDLAGNANSTGARLITLDTTSPLVDFGEGTLPDGSVVAADYIYVNVTVAETNFNNITFYLYNSTGHMLNQSNFTTQQFFLNFTNLQDTNELYYYNVTVRDKAGLANSSPTYNITLDTTDPEVRLDQPPDFTVTSGNTGILFNFTPFDTNLDNCTLFANFTGSYKANQSKADVQTATKNSFSPMTLPSGTYIWNVRCFDRAGNFAFNDTNFTLTIDTESPATFTLQAPPDGAYSNDLTPLLNWSETQDANFKNYTVLVSMTLDFSPPTYTYATVGNISNTSYQVTSPWTANQIHYWRVVAYDTLGFYTNATEDFNYTTDTIAPHIFLEGPGNNTVWTSSTIVDFTFNTTDLNPIANCTLVVNDELKHETDITNGTSVTIQYSLGNGNYDWYINCTDQAGNRNISDIWNLSVYVQIPRVTFYESYGSSGSATINLNYTDDGNEDTYAKLMTKLVPNTFITAVTSQGVKNNGFLIKGGQPVNFSGSFSGSQNARISWRLYYNNGTHEPLIMQDGNLLADGALYSSPAQETVSSQRNSTPLGDIYLRSTDKIKIINYLYYTTGANVIYTHYFDNGQSFVKLYGYILGFMNVNLSAPLTDPQPGEGEEFNVTCNVTCVDGFCMGSDVHVQAKTPSTDWSDVTTGSGNIRLAAGTSNPQAIGNVNYSQQRNFTLLGYAISRNNQIRCVAESDYSSANGSITTYVTVRDTTHPTLYLNSPENKSFDADGAMTFSYTPSDNYNISNCTLIINDKANITNHTITRDTTNYFNVNFGYGEYNWSVNCTDSFGNTNSSKTWTVTVDNVYPTIGFDSGTPPNDTAYNRDYVFVNITAYDQYEENVTFYLFNSTGHNINTTTLQALTREFNFTNLNTNMRYYYNVSIMDKALNENSTSTWTIVLDSTDPTVSLDAPPNMSWSNSQEVGFTYTPSDANIDACVLYHNSSGAFSSDVSNTTIVSDQQTTLTTTLSDGSHVWNIWCNDTAGNSAFNNTNLTMHVDTVFPTIEYAGGTAPDMAFRSQDYIYVNVSVYDKNEANITFYLYNITYHLINATTLPAYTLSINFTNLNSNMEYYYNVSITDKAGNENGTSTRHIILDTLAPNVTLTTPGHEAWDSDGVVTMSYYMDDTGTDYLDECHLYGNFTGAWKWNQTDSSPRDLEENSFTALTLNDGTFIWNVWCNDSAGNANWSQQNYTLFVDSLPPVILLQSPLNASHTSQTTLGFDFYLVEVEGHQDECQLWANFSGSWARNITNTTPLANDFNTLTTSVPEGTFVWNVWCNDSAGNSAWNNTNWTVTVDITPPYVAFAGGTAPDGTFYNRSWVYVNVSASDNHVANVTFFLYNSTGNLINETVLAAGTRDFNFTGLDSNEEYRYNVTVADLANNRNSTPTRTITLDSTPPFIAYTDPTPEHNWNQTSSSVVINVTHTETNPGYLTLDWNGTNQTRAYGGDYTNITKSGLADGIYTYYVWVNDSAGNWNVTETRTLRIDNAPPMVVQEAPPDDKWTNNENITFSFNVTDQLIAIANCSLVINSTLNMTNSTIREDTSQWFKVVGFRDQSYAWSVNCTDTVGNENESQTWKMKVDLTYPAMKNMAVNVTVINITETLCLNATVTDTLSGVNKTWAVIHDPNSFDQTVYLSKGTSTCNRANNPDVYSATFQISNIGIFNWTYTYANDTSGNTNLTFTGISWNATSIGTMTVNMSEPSVDFRINESDAMTNYTFNMTCTVVCDDKPQNCSNVTLYAVYNYSTVSDITTTSPYLRSHNSSYNVGNLTAGGLGANYTFVIRATEDSGASSWQVWCRAGSKSVGTYYSDERVNLSVNDHPAANFTYPANATWLSGTERLNASSSTDDVSVSSYSFELDNNSLFDSPTALCTGSDENCTFDTVGQTQCGNETMNCFIRLSVTDSDGLENTTYITVGIDNVGPTSILDLVRNWTNSSALLLTVNATVTDGGSGVDTALFYYRPDASTGWTLACTDADQALPYECTWDISVLQDSSTYEMRVFSNDTEGNRGGNDTHYNMTLDKTPPVVRLESPDDNGWSQENVTFYYNVTDTLLDIRNCSLVIDSKVNLTNSTITEDATQSFTQRFPDGAYQWRINCTDYAGNENTSLSRTINVDNTGPVATLDRPQNFTNITQDHYMLNASVTDSGIGVNVTVFEYKRNLTDSWKPACHVNSSSAPFNCTWNTTLLPDSNQYQVKVSANDSLANMGGFDVHFNITIDRTPPAVQLIFPENNSRQLDGGIVFRYNVSDFTSDIVNCSIILDQQLNKTEQDILEDTEQTITVLGISQGFHNWSINCTDRLGNIGSSLTFNFTVFPDTGPPVIYLISPWNGTNYTMNTVTFYYNVTDTWTAIKNCSLVIDDRLNVSSQWVPQGSTQSFTIPLADGNYTWSVNCTDNSTGYYNVGTGGTFNLTVSKTAFIVVDVAPAYTLFEKGELARFITNTSDKFGWDLETNITTYITTGNATLPWWNATFDYRKIINITNQDDTTLEANFTINHTIDTQTLINESKMQDNCDDLRVLWWDNETNSWEDLDRIVKFENTTYTEVWFKTKENISVAASSYDYYVYYGNTTIANPPTDKSGVYFYHDGFDTNTLSSYDTTASFDEASEDADGTLAYDATRKLVNYTGTSGKGKSLRLETLPIADAIIEVDQYYENRNGLYAKLELGTRVNTDSYYYFWTSTNIWDSEIGRYNSGSETYSNTTDVQYIGLGVWHHLTFTVRSNATHVFLVSYVDGDKLLAWEDNHSTNRLTGAGGFGVGAYQFNGSWDNITVRRLAETPPVSSNLIEQELIHVDGNSSGIDASWIMTWDTENATFGNYSVISKAVNSNYNDGVGFANFELGPDLTPPTIVLNYPVNGFNTSNTTIVFNWTATDRVDDYPSCNISLNGVLNGSNITYPSGEPSNFTIRSLGEGFNYWNVTCIDDNNNSNTSPVYSFVVVYGPTNVTIALIWDNVSVRLNWSNVSYADSFAVFISGNHSSFGPTPNVTGISDLNWTDYQADTSYKRFYQVATVRGGAYKSRDIVVGKHTIPLQPEWNLLSLPLNMSEYELKNQTNNAYDPPVRPLGCVTEIWTYNNSLEDDWLEVTYETSYWEPATGDEQFEMLKPQLGYWFYNNLSVQCNLTFVGWLPLHNTTANLDENYTMVGWHSEYEPALPMDCDPPYPIRVSPVNSVNAMYYYDPLVDLFRGTMHHTWSGCSDDDWGWYPDGSNAFTYMRPGYGYYFNTLEEATWTIESSR